SLLRMAPPPPSRFSGKSAERPSEGGLTERRSYEYDGSGNGGRMAAFKAIDERSEGSFKEGSAKDRFRSAKSVKRGASPARPRQVDGIMHEYQMQNAAARRAEASNHSKKGIGGTVLFLMLLVCTAAVGWGGYQYKQALSLELRLSELQRKHTRLASKLSDDVPASVSRIFPSSSSSSSSSRCEVEGEDGAVEGTCSPFPTERSEGDSAGWREGSGSEEESDRERRSSKEKAKEKSKEKKEEEEEEEEVKEDQELFWRRVALLASILCLVLPIFIIRNIDEVAQLFGRRPKATDGHTTAAASSSSSSSTSAAAAAAAAAGAAPSAAPGADEEVSMSKRLASAALAPGADEEVSMSKRLAYKADVLFSMHSWVKGAALLAATLLLYVHLNPPASAPLPPRLLSTLVPLERTRSCPCAAGAEEEVSMSKRLAYKADVLFSMHSIALGGLALYAVGSKDRMDLGDATWRAWSYVADAGNHADSEGVGPRIVGVSISIGGMLIFALMVGLVSEGISEKVDSLKKGKSDVIEKNHTLILGWSDKLVGRIAAEATGSGEREHGRGRGVVEMMIPPLGLCIAAEATGSGEREHGRGRGVVEMMIPPLGLCIAAEATGSGEREHGRGRGVVEMMIPPLGLCIAAEATGSGEREHGRGRGVVEMMIPPLGLCIAAEATGSGEREHGRGRGVVEMMIPPLGLCSCVNRVFSLPLPLLPITHQASLLKQLAVANESMGGGVVMASLLKQLAVANESMGGGVVVVMSEREKEEMESEIQKMEFNFRGTTAENADAADARALRVVLSLCSALPLPLPLLSLSPPPLPSAPLRSPLVLADLKKVSVSTARALIVLAEAENADAADARALRVVLSLMGVREGLRLTQFFLLIVGFRLPFSFPSPHALPPPHAAAAPARPWCWLISRSSGSPLVLADLKKVSVSTARALIVLAEAENADAADARALRVVLSLTGVREGLRGHIVVELSDIDNQQLVKMVGGRMVETVVAHDVIGRLMIQCARQPGLAQIWETLLGFENCEFYTKHWPELVGKTFREVLLSFPDAVPCGLRVSARTYYEKSTEAVGFEFAGGSSVGSEDEEEEGEEGEGGGEGEGKRVHKEHTRLWLNPDDDYVLQPEDSVLVIAEDDDSYAPGPLPVVQDAPLPDIETPPKLPEKILFCGWRRDIDDMITVLEAFLARGSELWIFSDVPVEEREARLIEGGLNPSELENVMLVHRMGNAVIRRHLEFLPLETFDSILILADEGLEDSIINCDSRSLATLLLIRDIQSKRMPAGSKGHRRSNSSITYPRPTSTSSWVGQMQQASQQSIVISEILDSRTRSLVSVSKISDYVLSNELVSMALAMVAEDREVNRVLEELFSEEGNEMYIRPAEHYLTDGEELSFFPLHPFTPLCTPLHPSVPLPPRQRDGNKIYIHPAELYLADGEELSFFEMAGNEMYIRPAELYLTDGEELSFFEVAVRARQHMEIIISSATGSSLSSLCTPLHPSIPLLSSFQGNEMYIRPAELYLTDGEELSFFEVAVRARQRMEIIIGYRLFTEDEAVLNPPDKAERRTWSIQDTFIVLSFNE
ncbi:unnamed protein product, partial [Closterium sp. NIES-65]